MSTPDPVLPRGMSDLVLAGFILLLLLAGGILAYGCFRLGQAIERGAYAGELLELQVTRDSLEAQLDTLENRARILSNACGVRPVR